MKSFPLNNITSQSTEPPSSSAQVSPSSVHIFSFSLWGATQNPSLGVRIILSKRPLRFNRGLLRATPGT